MCRVTRCCPIGFGQVGQDFVVALALSDLSGYRGSESARLPIAWAFSPCHPSSGPAFCDTMSNPNESGVVWLVNGATNC